VTILRKFATCLQTKINVVQNRIDVRQSVHNVVRSSVLQFGARAAYSSLAFGGG
jgi:hypothetical protein